MKTLVLMLILGLWIHPAKADTADEKDVVATVQKLFDAMSARDSEGAKAVLMPEGRTVAVRPDGKVGEGSQAQFAARLGQAAEPLLERMWNPAVMISGRVAQVWAEYDFHRAGKFSHCGVDSFSLVKTADGWKIASIAYTIQTEGCKPSPLGAPQSGQPPR